MARSWFDDDIFDDPDLETPEEILVYAYLFAKASMIGIAPWMTNRVKTATRLTRGKVEKARDSLIQKDKIEALPGGAQIWVKAKLNRSLYGGNCSEKQMLSVCKQLKKVEFSTVYDQFSAGYGQFWVKKLLQLYATKYQIAIPYTPLRPPLESESESDTVSESEINKERTATPLEKEKPPDKRRVDKGDMQFIAGAVQRFIPDAKNPFAVAGRLLKATRPTYLMYAMLRLKYRLAQGDLDNRMGYLMDIIHNRDVTPSACQGGDAISFQEHLTVEDWYYRIFPERAPRASPVRGGEMMGINEILKSGG